ncbi:MAG: class I SAM-dependent methyltransferase [Candidatus Omnitrophica bacterium]|nr:class I SAM-dependent methyltransferase [Candidatus Omnitrophota bacterium]
MSKASFLSFLALPEAAQLSENLDDVSTTLVHRRILQQKKFLRRIYREYYQTMRAGLGPDADQKTVLEIGSGAGFIKEVLPHCLTSDLIGMDGLDLACSALDFPFKDDSLDAVVMINVLHHLPDVSLFFSELRRCLKSGGRVIMIEPANTWWGKFVYTHFHHEPFDEQTRDWQFTPGGRLTDANVALPWMVFFRDRERFQKEYPDLRIVRAQPHTPFRYLLSGGFTMRSLAPSFSYGLIKGLGVLLTPLHRYLGMFMTVELEYAPTAQT